MGNPEPPLPGPPPAGTGLPAPRPPVPVPQQHAEAPLSSPEDLSDSEETFPKDITKWNSNDLMDKIESPELEDTQGNWLACYRSWEGGWGGTCKALL